MSKSEQLAECTAFPQDAEARYKLLRKLAIIDTPPEAMFDTLTRMASKTTGRPIALLGLVGPESTWLKSVLGMDVGDTPNDISFCAQAVEQDGIFEVNDARVDPRFSGNPLVTGDHPIVFYVGVSLKVEGVAVGTLCVVDHAPYQLSPIEREMMTDLAAIAERALLSRNDAMWIVSGLLPLPGT